jgi:hypothetical protein
MMPTMKQGRKHRLNLPTMKHRTKSSDDVIFLGITGIDDP